MKTKENSTDQPDLAHQQDETNGRICSAPAGLNVSGQQGLSSAGLRPTPRCSDHLQTLHHTHLQTGARTPGAPTTNSAGLQGLAAFGATDQRL